MLHRRPGAVAAKDIPGKKGAGGGGSVSGIRERRQVVGFVTHKGGTGLVPINGAGPKRRGNVF